MSSVTTCLHSNRERRAGSVGAGGKSRPGAWLRAQLSRRNKDTAAASQTPVSDRVAPPDADERMDWSDSLSLVASTISAPSTRLASVAAAKRSVMSISQRGLVRHPAAGAVEWGHLLAP